MTFTTVSDKTQIFSVTRFGIFLTKENNRDIHIVKCKNARSTSIFFQQAYFRDIYESSSLLSLLLKFRKQTLEKRFLCSKLRSWRLKLNLSVKTRLRNEERKMFQETTENNTIHINNHGKLMKVEWAPTVTGSQEVEITKIMTTGSNDWWEERKFRQFFSKSGGLV